VGVGVVDVRHDGRDHLGLRGGRHANGAITDDLADHRPTDGPRADIGHGTQ
jgi:hypothetical protein